MQICFVDSHLYVYTQAKKKLLACMQIYIGILIIFLHLHAKGIININILPRWSVLLSPLLIAGIHAIIPACNRKYTQKSSSMHTNWFKNYVLAYFSIGIKYLCSYIFAYMFFRIRTTSAIRSFVSHTYIYLNIQYKKGNTGKEPQFSLGCTQAEKDGERERDVLTVIYKRTCRHPHYVYIWKFHKLIHL